jgi:hypothetical protein
MSWYDNEWGFSNRMADTAAAIGRTLAGSPAPAHPAPAKIKEEA